VYSLLMFLLRKSDLLIVAYFMPLSYVGAFKLAFLLAEAPSQFVQAFLVTKTPAMLETTRGNFSDAQLRLAQACRSCWAAGCSWGWLPSSRWPRRCSSWATRHAPSSCALRRTSCCAPTPSTTKWCCR
jgi:hypothetical protein